MIALTWDRTWDLYIWALFTSPSGMNSAIKIRRRKNCTLIHNVESKNPYGRATGSWDSNAKLWPCKGFRKGKYASVWDKFQHLFLFYVIFLNSSSSFDSILSFLGLVAMILPAAAFATFIFCTAWKSLGYQIILRQIRQWTTFTRIFFLPLHCI